MSFKLRALLNLLDIFFFLFVNWLFLWSMLDFPIINIWVCFSFLFCVILFWYLLCCLIKIYYNHYSYMKHKLYFHLYFIFFLFFILFFFFILRCFCWLLPLSQPSFLEPDFTNICFENLIPPPPKKRYLNNLPTWESDTIPMPYISIYLPVSIFTYQKPAKGGLTALK